MRYIQGHNGMKTQLIKEILLIKTVFKEIQLAITTPDDSEESKSVFSGFKENNIRGRWLYKKGKDGN